MYGLWKRPSHSGTLKGHFCHAWPPGEFEGFVNQQIVGATLRSSGVNIVTQGFAVCSGAGF